MTVNLYSDTVEEARDRDGAAAEDRPEEITKTLETAKAYAESVSVMLGLSNEEARSAATYAFRRASKRGLAGDIYI